MPPKILPNHVLTLAGRGGEVSAFSWPMAERCQSASELDPLTQRFAAAARGGVSAASGDVTGANSITVLVFSPSTGATGENKTVTKDFSGFDMANAELEAFAVACADGAAYPVPDADVIHGIAVLEAIVKSAESGAPQKVG